MTRFDSHCLGRPATDAPMSDDSKATQDPADDLARQEWELDNFADPPPYPDLIGINPKDALGSAKPSISAVPQIVIAEVGVAMLEGALKYGRHNYREAPIRASVYVDAVKRHVFDQFWDMGEDIDIESRLSHITKGIASLVTLRDGMITGHWVDDRPPPVPKAAWTRLFGVVKWLHAKYPNPKAPITAKSLAAKIAQDGRSAGD
jgi:hypothetical protein